MRSYLMYLISLIFLGCTSQVTKGPTQVFATNKEHGKLESRKNRLTTKLSSIREKIALLQKRIMESEMVDINDLIGTYHGRGISSMNDFIMTHYEKELSNLEKVKNNLESELTSISL